MMNKNKLNDLLKMAINASLKGGEQILEIYDTNFSVEFKEDMSPLTLADKKCNEIIEQNLKHTGLPLLSEEGSSITYEKRKDWEYFWLIDPLDGTKEFVKRNGEFTVNIALVHNNLPILGVIYAPVIGNLYFGLKGLGSYKFNISSNNKISLDHILSSAIRLPLFSNQREYTIVGSRSHMSKETEHFFQLKKKEYTKVNILSVGSSLKLCMVAEGSADVYPRYAPTMEWDTAAGHAIAKFAGCLITQYQSNDEVVYNKSSLINPWFLIERHNV